MADCIILNRAVEQTTETQTELLRESLEQINKQLALLNARTEEAFETTITEEDIPNAN
jgi:hypothetical protein